MHRWPDVVSLQFLYDHMKRRHKGYNSKKMVDNEIPNTRVQDCTLWGWRTELRHANLESTNSDELQHALECRQVFHRRTAGLLKDPPHPLCRAKEAQDYGPDCHEISQSHGLGIIPSHGLGLATIRAAHTPEQQIPDSRPLKYATYICYMP